jgi:drug/metabolite transporter superfamily protein YnfA
VTRAGLVAGALLALRAAPASAVPFVLARSFAEPTPVRYDVFGAAVAAAGSAIAIGASRNDAAGTDAGAVYLVDPASGGLVATLRGAAAGCEFGSALAAVGTHLAVGSPDATAGAPRAGVVTLFPLGGAVPERVIANPAPAASELFGSALAALGSSLAIGVPYRDAAGAAAAGAVYLVDPDSGATLLELANPAPTAYARFGTAIAGAGTSLVVGAPYDGNGLANAGAVYVFDGTTGALVRTLTSPRPAVGAAFGAALAATDTQLLVGAPLDPAGGSAAGAAYLFDLASGTLLQTFLPPAGLLDSRFGAAVALAGTTALVAAPLASAGSVPGAGSVFLFDAASPTPLWTFTDPAPTAGDQFGGAIAFVGQSVLVGAWFAGGGSGAAYLFADQGPTTTTLAPSTTTTSTTVSTSTSTTTVTTTTTTITTTTTVDGATTTTTTTPATTTVTLPATSTTVATTTTTLDLTGRADPTTSTTLASPGACVAGMPEACDDGDPCTLDACVGGVCTHEAPPGLAAVACRLATLQSLLAPGSAPRPLLHRLRARIVAAQALVRRAAAQPPGRAQRTLARAARALGAFVATAEEGMTRHRLEHGFGAHLVDLAIAAANDLGA